MAGGTSDTGARRFSRIPPESTGDRMYMVHTAEIEYNGKQALDTARGTTHEWKIGSRYDIGGAFGTVHVHGVYEKDNDSGILAVHYNKTAKFENTVPQAAATISLDGDQKAAVVAAYDVYIPTTNIMGYDNPEYGMDVDITGSANVRFAEGLPQLDAWGKLRVNGATHIGDYVFGQEDVLTKNFSPTFLGGGSVLYDDDRNSVTVKVPASSATGFASNSSNAYHHYIAGSSHLYMGTARLSNPALTGVVRNWGMFDASNGFMFRLNDSAQLGVVIRTNTSGSVVDTFIPRSDWNGDKLDGTGDSQEIIDLSKDNIFWIDVAWHGAGRVRFGTYVDGQRVVCHSYYHGNRYTVAMSATTSLPVCWSVKATSAPAEECFIETWSASVWTESTVDLNEKGAPSTYASTHVTITADGSDPWQYLFSIAPKDVLPNGETNHSIYMPTSISAYAYDTTATNGLDAIIDLKAEINAVHEGHSFAEIPGSLVEVSTAGNSYENGKLFLNEMFRGRVDLPLTNIFNNWQNGAVKNFADDGGTVVNNILSVTTGNAGSPPVVTVAAGEVLKIRDEAAQGTPSFPANINEYNGRFEFYDIPSVPEIQGNYYYIKPIAANQFEIYTDSALTTGATVTSTHVANEGTIKGFRGSRVIWSFFAKTRTAIHPTGPVKMMVTINWKEIIQ